MPQLQHSRLVQKHNRLFELIRQKNQADELSERAASPSVHTLSANELIKFKKVALRSLQAQP